MIYIPHSFFLAQKKISKLFQGEKQNDQMVDVNITKAIEVHDIAQAYVNYFVDPTAFLLLKVNVQL